MDKDEDYELYSDLSQQLRNQTTETHKRNVLRTRILNLSTFRNRTLYAELGAELLDSGKPQESLTPLKRATIISPRNDKAWINLATALFKLEREDEAFACIKKGFSLSPNNCRFGNLVIKIFEERNRLEDLGPFYAEIAKALPDPKSIPVFYYDHAENFVSNNKYPQALQMYKKAIEADSMDYGYHYQYAMALYHECLFEEAIVKFEHVVRLNPTNKLAWNNIAYLNYCAGKVEKAREKYEDIIEKGYQIYATYSNFIVVLSHLGEGEEVIDQYKDLFRPYIQSHVDLLRIIYKEAVRITEVLLQRDDIDEETREFNSKKLKGTNLILSLLN